ncbi:hypothetical protein A3A21_01150 [Candidatus Jorgensenbacteria bacterium RIFCSPLOWO2_01_FULL_45_25b]|uniref:Cytidyltransferase-like domain-containing protein n=1 Tax=Candidatus Jorgensenbacteria bacterium RIFCSPLOWO2_01_FULL_45_25b TaxID=1798471 RepID=A0A1F6BU60_9BACT|nr:MAG: hypothetical protein A3A21_01150 [Candidatus Jorgensenbacteria bacterium RIFCSPLOWO2_01_FULL_45_25b]
MKKQHKIKNKKEIEKIAARLKREGKKIVVFNGSFDLLHGGHIQSLEEAKSKGDVLIVLLNSDVSVQSYKSVKRPIVGEKERANMLAALQCVDMIALFDETNPKKLLEKIKPDIYCNGADWGKNCVERSVVEKHGGKIHVLSWKRGLSTSNMIKKILDVYANSPRKAIFVEKTLIKNKKEIALKGFMVFLIPKETNIDVVSKYILAVAKRRVISLSDSYVVGESEEIVLSGREINAKTIKIGERLPRALKIEPHHYARNIKEARQYIQNCS